MVLSRIQDEFLRIDKPPLLNPAHGPTFTSTQEWLKQYMVRLDELLHYYRDMQPWMTVAERELGQRRYLSGKGNNPKILEYFKATSLHSNSQDTAWCAAFVNWCLKQNKIPGTNSAMATSFSNYGQKLDKLAFGSIVVLSFHHVAFVWGKTPAGKIGILGGNQGPAPNGVNIGAVSLAQIKHIRYPAGRTPDYKLKAFSGQKTYHLDMQSTR